MIRAMVLSAVVASVIPYAGWCQAGAANSPANGVAGNCTSPYKNQDLLIQLDTTGISNWRYLNARAPFPVVLPATLQKPTDRDAWEHCAELADVGFANSASGQALTITIPYVYRRI